MIDYLADRMHIALGAIVGLFVLLLVFALPIYTYACYQNERVLTCEVTGKDRAAGQSGSDMRVYTADCGNLSVADATFAGHFSSSDVYASIEPGRTYDLRVNGFRVPFLSLFPNVLEATPSD